MTESVRDRIEYERKETNHALVFLYCPHHLEPLTVGMSKLPKKTLLILFLS